HLRQHRANRGRGERPDSRCNRGAQDAWHGARGIRDGRKEALCRTAVAAARDKGQEREEDVMTAKRWSHEASAARAWWDSLRPHRREGPGRPGDRPRLARLRRAASIIEAMAEPATADLHRRMGLTSRLHGPQRAALLAAVLAHVRSDNQATTVAGAIGK